MKKTKTPVRKKTVAPTKVAASKKKAVTAKPKAVAPKKAATAKRGKAEPTTTKGPSPDSEWIVGPYGDLMSKKDLGLLITTRTRVS